jgi:DNA-directed RNA polymerase subunit RPC12/RpoP
MMLQVPEQTAEDAVPLHSLCSSQFTSQKQAEDRALFSPSKICNSEYCNALEHNHLDSASHSCQVRLQVMPNLATPQQHCAMHSPKSGLEHHEHKYCCQKCNQEFSDWKEIAEHVEGKHVGLNEVATCSTCCQTWLAGKEFLVHYQSCHMTEKTKDTARPCPVCHKVFSQASALNHHLKLHSPLSCHHTCELFSDVILHNDLMLVHSRQHYGTELPESYKELEHLLRCGQQRRESMKRKSFICEYCGREFSKKLNLQLHVRRHTGERPYGCQLCGKAFYTNQQLAIHVRRHTGERPYACGICAKAFTGPTALYVHRKLHDKVKRYLCPHCGKRFFWRSAFIGHIRVHTGERPYRCTICTRAFTLKGRLNLHLKKHPVLECADCGENFGSEAELNAHRSEQCCVTMVTFVEEGPSGKRDTRIIVVNTADLENNLYRDDDSAVVQLVV